MKKMLLTLALAVASFAGVNAQDWSLSIGTGDGLPGENVQKGANTVQVYKSDVIKPTEALTTLRFTVAQNYNGERPNGNNFITALSELVVYAADGTTVIPYTATSNADHNTLSGGRDGAGLAALNDGNWNNYWHSNWSYNIAVADYHYLELTFEAPVSEFILEWGARPGNPKNAPMLVGLTKGGVDYVPYSDWAFTVGNQITSMDQLEGAQYFVMKSNVPVEYHTYVNTLDSPVGAFGTQTTKEPNIGPGPLYAAPGVQAEEPAPSYAIQLIPAEGGYYLYYVAEGKFLSANPADNAYNGANGGQGKTAKMSDAAIVTITEDGNGRFEMSYMMEYEGEKVEIHVGATPFSGGFKNVDKERYDFYKEGHPYCLNYAYILTFDWTFEEVTMNYPAKYAAIPVRNAIKEAKSIYTFMDSVAVEGYEEAYDEFIVVLCETESKLATGAYTDVEKVFADVETLNEAMGAYVYSKIEWVCNVYIGELRAEYEDAGLLVPSYNPQDGYYLQEAWDTYIIENLGTRGSELWDMAGENPYAYINDMKTFINGIQGNVDSFLASKITFVTLPKVYTSEDPHYTPLGTKVNNNRWDWEQLVTLNEAVNGIRLTFLETNAGSAMGDGKYQGFPMVALAGLEIKDGDGNLLALSSDLVTSNSEEVHERENGNGTIDKLFDDDADTYYHSAWASGARYDQPYTYIYLDIKFPEGVSLKNFTIKTIGRRNASLAPGTVCITKYGEEYDPDVFRENPYNVAGGTQITDASQLKDGGLYIISGNNNVKTQGVSPRYYAGVVPYHTDIKAALNEPCVYMFKKTEKGWNIISLANAQYWALNKEVTENTNEVTGETTTNTSWSTGLTVYPSNAAEVNFVKSGNLENTFVIYSELEDNYIDASWNWADWYDVADEINIEVGTVNANKFVFMDWGSNLVGRPCASILPGDVTYGKEILEAHAKYEDFVNGDGYSAGDYLHFNKANGEGEWNIYEVSMDDAYYLWANGIPATLSALGLVVGNDPGCITGDIAALEAAVEAVEAVVENEDKENAQAAVEAFVANVGLAQDAERVEVMDSYWYAIESAYTEYYKQQGKIKAIYATEAGLSWMDAPAAYNRENAQFVFQFQQYDGENDPYDYGNIPAGEEKNVFFIYSGAVGMYAGTGGGTTQVVMTDDKVMSQLYVVKPLEANIYTIYAIGSDPLHTAGHGSGAGTQGTVVNWAGGAGSASSWTLRLIDSGMEPEPEPEMPSADLKDELIRVKDKLKSYIEGFYGNQIISDARELVYAVEANIDLYNEQDALMMIDRLNNAYAQVCLSVRLRLTNGVNIGVSDETKTLPFELNNAITNFTGFQCNVYLPAGFRIAENEDGDYDVTLNKERVTSSHTIVTEKKNDGSYLILCYSSKSALIKGESGVLFNINIEAEGDVNIGEYTVECKDIFLSTDEGVEFKSLDSNDVFRLVRLYDTNKDGVVGEDDIETLAYYLIGKVTDSYDNYVYDVDHSGVIDLKDLQVLTDVIQGRSVVTEDELYINEFYLEDIHSLVGGDCSLPVNLEYTGEATAFRIRVDNPSTMAIAPYDVKLTERATESHRALVWGDENATSYNIIVYSTNNEPLNGNSGDVYNVCLETENITGNVHGCAKISLVDACSPNGVLYTHQHTCFHMMYFYLPADADKNNIADVADLGEVVTALAGESYRWSYLEKHAADLNRDSEISIIDIAAMADVVRNGYVEREMNVLPDNGDLQLEFGDETTTLEQKIHLPLHLKGVHAVTAIQFDLSISGKATIESVELADAVANTHICETKELDGFTRVVIYSADNDVINEDFIMLTINGNKAVNKSTVAVSNIMAATVDFNEYRFALPVQALLEFYKEGDVNGDDKVSIADVVLTVNALMGNIHQNFVFCAADLNFDGKISIGDVVLVVNKLLEEDKPVTPSPGSINIGEDVQDAVTNAPAMRGMSNMHVSNAVVENNEATVVISLDDAHMYTAMQFDIALPAGVAIKDVAVKGKHIVAHNESRIVVYSLTNSVLGSGNGMMTITLNVDNLVDGEIIAFDNIIVSTSEFAERRLGAVDARLEGATGIAGTENVPAKVYAENGRIVIESACDQIVDVISSNGIVRKVEIATGKNYVAVEHKGIYLVKVAGRVTKLTF